MDNLNSTHDPQLRSWLESANQSPDFPIQNLPFGIFQSAALDEARVGVAIGDAILDLTTCVKLGILEQQHLAWCKQSTLNSFLALGQSSWSAVRQQLSALLASGSEAAQHAEHILVPQSAASLLMPVSIGDYTDAYASIDHATNVGRLFRPDSPLLPNYKYVPIAYHGRASSVVLSGTEIIRPMGQLQNGHNPPGFGSSQRLDYEAELGVIIGPGNPLGQPIPIATASQHMFGFCLVHDWSARDIQRWEYQPLGPFLSKSFATSISPWIVTTEALAPFRIPAYPRPTDDPQPLPYLLDKQDQQSGGFNITVEVFLGTAKMRKAKLPAQRISHSSMASMYWTMAQIVAHHSSNGCNLRPGDLIASGTISGPNPGEQGCLLEISRGGTVPLTLENGESRSFLLDGDEVTLSAYAEQPGFRRISLGSCVGRVVDRAEAGL